MKEVPRTPGLPFIERVVAPPMEFTSTKIRWYRGIGYSCSEVANFLGIKYQQVRNVSTTDPKRGAREVLPALIIDGVRDAETEPETEA
jgi:hypothetical protein